MWVTDCRVNECDDDSMLMTWTHLRQLWNVAGHEYVDYARVHSHIDVYTIYHLCALPLVCVCLL